MANDQKITLLSQLSRDEKTWKNINFLDYILSRCGIIYLLHLRQLCFPQSRISYQEILHLGNSLHQITYLMSGFLIVHHVTFLVSRYKRACWESEVKLSKDSKQTTLSCYLGSRSDNGNTRKKVILKVYFYIVAKQWTWGWVLSTVWAKPFPCNLHLSII